MTSAISIAAALGVSLAAVGAAQGTAARIAPRAAADSAAVVGVLSQFHDALARADTAAARALLDSSLVVLESGEVETRADYLRHHLPADIAFSRAVRETRRVHQVRVRGDAAWVASGSRAQGTFDGRAVDSEGAELVVLTRTSSGWRIAAIHWSSHRARP